MSNLGEEWEMIRCPECDGTGKEDCYECEGEGADELSGEVCTECNGDGSIECAMCGGCGQVYQNTETGEIRSVD